MSKRIVSVVMSILLSFSSLAFVLSVKASEELPPASIPAFPGAEGGGMYTSGGRGYDVYEVTNLDDSGPGSLRDAVSQDNRMVVFHVSGVINLKSDLTFNNRKNITVAGQTAPGDGICISGFDTDISNAYNIIIRYLRFRPGSANVTVAEPDALGGRGSNYLMVDHVSTSWSTDETLSFYQNRNTTIQWSIISQSLTLSGHFKGKHGYGGIWGGTDTTFHHNLLVTHTSRNPRYGNGNEPGSVTASNNVIYNWGFNSSYGGGAGLKTNQVNNYYKPGPSTEENVKGRILNPGDAYSEYYVSGNYAEGSPDVTADNTKGIHDIGQGVIFSDTPYINNSYTLLTNQNGQTDYNKGVGIQDAQVAYYEVLNKAGATYPRRDAIDAKVVQDVREGTGRTINKEYEIGGLAEYGSAEAPEDTDHDGIPDIWELENGLNPNDIEDGKMITASGYSNLELYINSLANMNYSPDNPVVRVVTPTYNELFAEGSQVKVDIIAADTDGIDRVEFYKDDVKMGEDNEAPYSLTIDHLPAGTCFITVRAYDNKGNATQSTSMPIHINGAEVGAPWAMADIGNTPVEGSGSLDASGIMTVKGSGKITGRNDGFHFVYQPISGNTSLTARIDYITLLDNNAISGLMIRESLEPDAVSAIISTSVVKAGRDENMNGFDDDTFYGTFFSSRMKKGDEIKTLDWGEPQDYLPYLVDHTLPLWLKIERVDDVIAAFTSTDGITWKELASKTFSMKKEAYIGFAVDATQSSMQDKYYNTAKFSNISLLNSFTVTNLQITDISGNSLTNVTPGMSVTAAVTVHKNSLAIEDAVIAVQLCDANGNVMGTSYVQSKFGIGDTKTVKATFGIPINLEGAKVKAFVINNINDEMVISDEIVK